jgi:hypothetical protein
LILNVGYGPVTTRLDFVVPTSIFILILDMSIIAAPFMRGRGLLRSDDGFPASGMRFREHVSDLVCPTSIVLDDAVNNPLPASSGAPVCNERTRPAIPISPVPQIGEQAPETEEKQQKPHDRSLLHRTMMAGHNAGRGRQVPHVDAPQVKIATR